MVRVEVDGYEAIVKFKIGYIPITKAERKYLGEPETWIQEPSARELAAEGICLMSQPDTTSQRIALNISTNKNTKPLIAPPILVSPEIASELDIKLSATINNQQNTQVQLRCLSNHFIINLLQSIVLIS